MQVITHSKHAVNIGDAERLASAITGSALAVLGLSRRSWPGVGLAITGAELIRRGLTGHSYAYEMLGVRTAPLGQGAQTTSVPYELGIRVDRVVTVNKPRDEVYRFFRNLENLPRFSAHVESVRPLDAVRSHWVVAGPAGRKMEWDARFHNEIESELIAWRSLPGAEVEHAGSVLFTDAPDGLGTEVRVELQYNPPGGILGAFAAKMWGEEPSQQIEEDLQRLKQFLEAGEIITTERKPVPVRRGEAEQRRKDVVQEASEESFPASDAPAWRGGVG